MCATPLISQVTQLLTTSINAHLEEQGLLAFADEPGDRQLLDKLNNIEELVITRLQTEKLVVTPLLQTELAITLLLQTDMLVITLSMQTDVLVITHH